MGKITRNKNLTRTPSFFAFFFLLEIGKMYFLPVFLLTCFLSAIEDVSAATAKYDWGRLAPVKTAQQLKRQAAPEAHASQTGEKRQRNSFGMCGTQSIIAAMENAAGIKNEARAEHMRQMDCATELRRMADPVPPLYDYHHAHGKKRQRNSFGMCGTQSIISALENAAGIKNEARAEKMRQMDCATHLTRLADSMQKRATHVPAHPAGHSCGGPCIYIGKKRQRNSFGMCGTQSIIAAMENAAGIKNEARAEKMRQMDCATHLRRLADSVPSSPLAQASQIGKKRQNGYFTGTQSIIAAMEHAAGNKRQRNSFGMCGTQSIIATMEDAAGIKNEARLEKMRQMDC